MLTGLAVLEKQNFKLVKNKKIGLVTNHTGINKKNETNIEIFLKNGLNLVCVFSPEHGLYGNLDDVISNTCYKNIPVDNLYNEIKKPTKEMLTDVDVLVFDIQDIGARFYTYISTMALCMEAAKENNIEFILLDRPNPITGIKVEGNLPEAEFLKRFTSYFLLPIRHGMTIGKLALMFNKEYNINCALSIVKLEDWKRKLWFDETELLWVPTSPAIKYLSSAILYPGIALLEATGTNLSEGRGTEKPFEYVGAPFIKKKN